MKSSDWTGNSKSVHSTLGASSHSKEERQQEDYYATDPKAVEMLLELENFQHSILEPACGEGHISKVLTEHGHKVVSSDLVNRGFGIGNIDFLNCLLEEWIGDIITNPPYSLAKEFVEKSMEVISDGSKVAMFLKLQFLEGQARKELFKKYPPRTVYVSSARLKCLKNGEDDGSSSAVAYCWFIWVKGFKGKTTIEWFN